MYFIKPNIPIVVLTLSFQPFVIYQTRFLYAVTYQPPTVHAISVHVPIHEHCKWEHVIQNFHKSQFVTQLSANIGLDRRAVKTRHLEGTTGLFKPLAKVQFTGPKL